MGSPPVARVAARRAAGGRPGASARTFRGSLRGPDWARVPRSRRSERTRPALPPRRTSEAVMLAMFGQAPARAYMSAGGGTVLGALALRRDPGNGGQSGPRKAARRCACAGGLPGPAGTARTHRTCAARRGISYPRCGFPSSWSTPGSTAPDTTSCRRDAALEVTQGLCGGRGRITGAQELRNARAWERPRKGHGFS